MSAKPHAVRIGDALGEWEGAYPVGGSGCEVGEVGMDAFGDTRNPPNRVISQMPAAPPATAATMLYGSSNIVSGHSVPWRELRASMPVGPTQTLRRRRRCRGRPRARSVADVSTLPHSLAKRWAQGSDDLNRMGGGRRRLRASQDDSQVALSRVEHPAHSGRRTADISRLGRQPAAGQPVHRECPSPAAHLYT